MVTKVIVKDDSPEAPLQQATDDVDADFLSGCFFDTSNEELVKIENERLAEAKKIMREPENYPWLCLKKTLSGVTLKHAFAHVCSYQEKDFYTEFCEAGSNVDLVFEPKEYPKLPEVWNDMHRSMTAQELKDLPLVGKVEIDLVHVAKAPVPMQPKQTNNLNKFTTFFVSPRKVITNLTSWGRGYHFCERFNSEHQIVLTEVVQPGAF